MERVVPIDAGTEDVDDITSRDESVRFGASRVASRSAPIRPTIDPDQSPRKGRPGESPRGGRPVRSGSSSRSATRPAKSSGRDMPTAIGVGLLIAAAFVITVVVSPKLVLAMVVVVIGLAAVEYFDKVSEKGYRPASIAGIIACVTLPIAAYWAGEQALPLIIVLAFVAGAVTFIGATSLESHRCRTWPSPRSAWSGSASSARSRR